METICKYLKLVALLILSTRQLTSFKNTPKTNLPISLALEAKGRLHCVTNL